MKQPPELVASAWTLAGNLPFPPAPGDRSRYTFEERARAAAAAGYVGMGMTFFDLPLDVADFGYPALRRILRENGLKYTEVDAVHSWFGEDRATGLALADELINAAAELGIGLVKVVGSLDGQTCPMDEMRETFAKLAENARQAGTKLGLEIMPQSNIMDPPTALAIIGDSQNSGIVLDIWHVTRRGIPYETLCAIPASMIASVELNDGDAHPRGDLLCDMTNHRKLCGTGSFDISAFISAITATGYAGYYSVEVLSQDLRKLPLEEMAVCTFNTALDSFGYSR